MEPGALNGKLARRCLWLVLLACGIYGIRKGHWVMFLVGIFLPIFWLIGALLPKRSR